MYKCHHQLYGILGKTRYAYVNKSQTKISNAIKSNDNLTRSYECMETNQEPIAYMTSAYLNNCLLQKKLK